MKHNIISLLSIITGILVCLLCTGFSNVILPERVVDMSVSQEQYQDLGILELNGLCDAILDVIIDPEMTEPERAYAIYQWVTGSISYVATNDFVSWQEGALYTLKSYAGDCYGFYAALRALLQRSGIRCTEAVSIPKDHYWVMACIDGAWVHLDATPGWGGDRFMLSTEELLSYRYYGNARFSEGLRYDFDPAGYPHAQHKEPGTSDSILDGIDKK